MAEFIDCDFPSWGLLPKKDTGVSSYLAKYPSYDGRDVIIAIFDSGVDPGAPGLQKTSDGRVKVIERYDCSGAGDVDTSKVVTPRNGVIDGLTGRKLKIPDNWVNPSGTYHVGVKNGFDLYPAKLRERIEKERKEKLWDIGHKQSLAIATRELTEFDANHVTPVGPDKVVREDLEARMDVLLSLEKKYHDVGPAYDCVVFHNGDEWAACVDTTECGDLKDAPLLREFSIKQDFATLTTSDQLNFSINVHDGGNVLEIVSMCSSHGTHVASIASSYFPGEPEKNGCAPGAQIVSLTIGDNRLGSMETGTALVRAMIRVMGRTGPKIDLINMSYGEHAHFSCSGRIGELMNEVVDKHRVIWIASAGNNGPALCTIGTPPDISTTNIIGVGAYVGPDMMSAEYSMRQKQPGTAYTWSSRGPTIDGDSGVALCAPGGAITSVPGFTLRNCQLMNGTSMASPHVTGATALLISGLKAKNIPFSPYSVKRALENSALFLSNIDPFAQGNGLLQVEQAFDHMTTYFNQPEREVRFQISCGPGNSKGIHLRGGLQDKPKEIVVNVKPYFCDPDNIDPVSKINFGLNLALTCQDSWVQIPAHITVMNMARMFNIKVDPSGLAPGVHSTSIKAYDVACVGKGPVFRVPVTVVRPLVLSPDTLHPTFTFSDCLFKPNTLERRFFLVPNDATWAVLTMQCLDKDTSGRFVIHTLQLRPKLVCKTLETHQMYNITSTGQNVHAFPVRGGLVLEVVVAKNWASLGEIRIDFKVTFRGVKPDSPVIVMQAADGILPVELKAALMSEDIAPVVTLNKQVQVLKPSDAKVMSLSSRDVIPPARQIYELQLTYNFHLNKATEVMPNSPLLSDLLYESEFEAQLWMLFDSNKQLLATGDAYPNKYNVKLEKGEYVIRLHVRHDRKDHLDKLTDQVLQLSQKLATPLSLDVYASQTQATTQGKKLVSACLQPGQVMPVYIAPIVHDKTNKSPPSGHFLTGTATFAKDEVGRKVDEYRVKYVLCEPSTKKSPPASKQAGDKERSKWEEMTEAMRDLKTSWLSKLEVSDQAMELYDSMVNDYTEHLAVHTAMLQLLSPIDLKKQLPWYKDPPQPAAESVHLARIVNIANVVASHVDLAQVLAYYGAKQDLRPDAAKIKISMERQRNATLDALVQKGIALCKRNRLDFEDRVEERRTNTMAQVEPIWNDVIKLADPTDNKVILFSAWFATAQGHFGRVMKYLLKMAEEKSGSELDQKIAETAQLLGWNHVNVHYTSALPVKYPSGYRPF